jgi:hypothetical protein
MAGAGGGEAEGLRREESVSGGVDVWSDAVSSHAPDHLLVMVHGILGRCTPISLAAPPSPSPSRRSAFYR